MSDYTKTVDFAAKDSLPSGNSGKIIKGTEFETEFDNIATAIATKANLAGPTFTGVLTFASFKGATGATVTTILDEDDMATNSDTALATQQSIKAYVDAQQDTVDTLAEILALSNTTGGTDIVVSADDVISLDDGTNLLPSLTTTGDLNTGVYFPSADNVGITTGGTQRLNVSSTGIDVTGTVTVDGTDTEAVTSQLLKVRNSTTGEAVTIGMYAKADNGGDGNTGSITFDAGADGSASNNSLRFSADHQTDLNPALKIDGNRDISFYEDTGTTAKLFWDASAESLGVGETAITSGYRLQTREDVDGESKGLLVANRDVTASGSQSVSVNFGLSRDSGAFKPQAGRIRVGRDSTTWDGSDANIDSYMDFSVYDSNVLSTKMTIDSSGNVGIGTASPAAKLHIENGDMRIEKDTKATIGFRGHTTGSTALAFRDSSAGVDRMTIDASGNVKIGTASDRYSFLTASTANLQIDGGIVFDSGAGNNVEIFNYRATDMLFGNSGAEDMRIDASGNLLVGKTAAALATAGIELRADNTAYFTKDSSTPVLVNRVTTDGDIIQFRKDNTTVGSIGAQGGDVYISSSASGHGGLRFANGSILPLKDGSLNAGEIDLGQASGDLGFKDLYLSGGAYLGGTAAANKLDDYEEGTFTATLSSGATTTPTTTGTYTKIGNRVYISLEGFFGSITVNGTALQITGLPFSNNGEGVDAFASCSQRVNFDSAKIQYWNLANGATALNLKQATSNANSVSNVLSESSGTYTPTFGNINFHYTT